MTSLERVAHRANIANMLCLCIGRCIHSPTHWRAVAIRRRLAPLICSLACALLPRSVRATDYRLDVATDASSADNTSWFGSQQLPALNFPSVHGHDIEQGNTTSDRNQRCRQYAQRLLQQLLHALPEQHRVGGRHHDRKLRDVALRFECEHPLAGAERNRGVHMERQHQRKQLSHLDR
jgi:hypothetical protein